MLIHIRCGESGVVRLFDLLSVYGIIRHFCFAIATPIIIKLNSDLSK